MIYSQDDQSQDIKKSKIFYNKQIREKNYIIIFIDLCLSYSTITELTPLCHLYYSSQYRVWIYGPDHLRFRHCEWIWLSLPHSTLLFCWLNPLWFPLFILHWNHYLLLQMMDIYNHTFHSNKLHYWKHMSIVDSSVWVHQQLQY